MVLLPGAVIDCSRSVRLEDWVINFPALQEIRKVTGRLDHNLDGGRLASAGGQWGGSQWTASVNKPWQPERVNVPEGAMAGGLRGLAP